jgi:hypothetical protein
MSKHTKGPWQASKDNRGAIPLQWQPHCVIGNNGSVIVARLPDGDGTTDRANVALIAAAPDLLAACKTVEAELNRAIHSRVLGETWTGLQLCLADAIRKAEGKDGGQ